MDTTARQVFIDNFFIPKKAMREFKDRTKINMGIVKKQPGFINEQAYEQFDEQGNLIYITIVVWENSDAIKKAKAAVRPILCCSKLKNYNFEKINHIWLYG